MLKADKEFLLTEYYLSKGLKYNPHVYDEKKRIKSPEELTRAFQKQVDEALEEFDDLIQNIDDDIALTQIDQKEKEKDEIYTKAAVASKALEHKLGKLEKYLD
mmetsp:Transcript_23008/g.25558  ORF Transcript_23008/g.25558 Transcript_23008/m.25558 type:complete len:103 (+) Transcript_23008:396-704(+)|eukprot:CAMPEP_0205827766 /NCGR_PEP_ID=MMETSP0206-20130828/33005_1 /ASSEMBLY_ACC=CAM_ASM_000279 /TAXON_ID=36767 /ORGANISM="Euplotes focardii, Strain TN1" /LENGTH=102 /DNA_ID=CAMNT_0053128951 /DNA_START=288 /DNA_END=596 /DNA_ORIENTATION=-